MGAIFAAVAGWSRSQGLPAIIHLPLALLAKGCSAARCGVQSLGFYGLNRNGGWSRTDRAPTIFPIRLTDYLIKALP